MNGAFINKPKKLILSYINIIFLLTVPWQTLGAGKMEEVRLPDEVLTEIAYLLNFIGTENKAPNFEPERIANLLGFAAKQNTNSRLYHAGKSFGIPSAYYGLDINRSLEDLLRYVYNPYIPYCSIAPSTVRICQLKETEKGQKSWPLLWKLLPDLDKPIIIKGVEQVTNTPDLFSGTYYSYDQDRTLILFKYQERKILASISKQKGKSDVGKKGLVLGTDDSWDYIYTGEEGLTKSGLGWVRSYMYDSFGIAVYYEINPSKPLVRCGIFRWVRAGWAKMNMVKPKHIYNGMERFAKAFKQILEYPELPRDSELAKSFSKIESMSYEELRTKIKHYLTTLENRYRNEKGLSEKWRTYLFEDEKYINQLKKEEMQSILFIEHLKQLLGKNYTMDASK